eukprot:CAMPEP_0183336802 /NCGR_PEP_ID=MMETSP0164_2-20130417/4668_1 /TAXON_ID=221442 /ORGANISM="Coccolithus pelagicus ssp braarudi, Strain PLY182g" /LENGTH=59 /DNA_ID=CAMNT_0025506397 /DNA_START=62 /DNA_END=241 /DNA_ORIENTATION=-
MPFPATLEMAIPVHLGEIGTPAALFKVFTPLMAPNLPWLLVGVSGDGVMLKDTCSLILS